jgi:hypothetical protein
MGRKKPQVVLIWPYMQEYYNDHRRTDIPIFSILLVKCVIFVVHEFLLLQ